MIDLVQRLHEAACGTGDGDMADLLREAAAEIERLRAELERLSALLGQAEHSLANIANAQYLRAERLGEALRIAEAALADIGDADREPGDDLEWCERRARLGLRRVRDTLRDHDQEGR